jgi:D-apiose dehydrogenase
MRAPLRVGMVGCGYISYQHGPAWLASPDAELVAVCDADLARARARGGEWGVERCYADPADMIERERLDAVDVVTRPETHALLVGLAAERGCHVTCQKPLAASLADAGAIVQRCDQSGVRFMVTEMWRYLPWFREMRRWLDAGAIGSPHLLRFVGSRVAYRRERPINDSQPYFADMPMLIVYEMMIHWIDASRFLLGDATSVYARLSRLNRAIVGEDAATVVLAHGAGHTTTMDGSWATPPEPDASTREGDIVLEGADGQLHLTPPRGELRLTTLRESRLVASYPDTAVAFQQAFNDCLGHFARAVRVDEPFESSAADNLKTLAATFAAYESARSGQVVALA